uniref:Turgencin-A n=1 Tax=Synoicum turgens TaxID=2697470 RepID=TURA_SYNTU|nr:RecName: Full=Turgencin-A [Synoicum turgens]
GPKTKAACKMACKLATCGKKPGGWKCKLCELGCDAV